jgi:hypothetical protein
MASFSAAVLRGVVALFAGILAAGGTLTLAADHVPTQRPTLVPVSADPRTLIVPDVRNEAYVFVKGILQDEGFAWHVMGPVQGYAANTIAAQQPAPGTRVVDTGAPTITLTLARNTGDHEVGTPENDAPYNGTAIELPAPDPTQTTPTTSVEPRVEPVPVPVAPAVPGTETEPAPSVPQTPTAPATTTPAPTTPAQTTPATTTPEPETPATETPAAPTAPATPEPTAPRSPDFTVPGAPKEPAGSTSLPDRAVELQQWLEAHRQPTAANLNHWLYEHAFLVAGARFGWWHGSTALQTLIEVDKRAEELWGVGAQSRTTAEKALAEVEARRS